jgi:hypothetical protein
MRDDRAAKGDGVDGEEDGEKDGEEEGGGTVSLAFCAGRRRPPSSRLYPRAEHASLPAWPSVVLLTCASRRRAR